MDITHLFIHSPDDGHLGHFTFLVIMNNATRNIYVQVWGKLIFSNFLSIYFIVELLVYMVTLHLTS